MRTLVLSLVLIGCGSVQSITVDAPPADTNGGGPDAPPAALDCSTYCNTIMTSCTGVNLQYADMNHCTGSCAAFVAGTSKTTDQTGDTLGCRIYHAGAAGGSTANATLHCPHAGPGGDALTATTPGFCSGGDACTNFCALQIKTCGSTDSPVMVQGTTITPQYQNMATCVSVCKTGSAAAGIAPFDVTHPYTTMSAGNSLACRLYHWTNAAAQTVTPSAAGVNLHCSHTAAAQSNALPCFATPPTP